IQRELHRYPTRRSSDLTGMEQIVARDSGVTVVADNPGWIEKVDSARIVLRVDTDSPDCDLKPHSTGVEIYNLLKYMRSNQNTCIDRKSTRLNSSHVKAR